MKILVVRLDHLGDVLLTTPLIRSLAMGGHSVDVLVQDALKPLFQGSGFVQTCYGIDAVAPGFPTRWWRLATWLRGSDHDLLILAYARERRLCLASLGSGIKRRMAMWSGIWGRLTGHECLPSHILDNPRPVSEILLEFSRALGLPDQGLQPDFPVTATEREEVWALLPPSFRGRCLIGIHPGSAGNACNLPSKVYRELAGLLLDQTDCGLVITGTIAEKQLLSQWDQDVLQSDRVWNSMGELGLRELACVVAELGVFVCSSTGPLHVASAVGTATVSPFCPSVPINATIWGNVGAPSRVVEPVACPRLEGKLTNCSFQGQIAGVRLLEEIKSLLTVQD